ncbi:hypothetical protein [Microbacterium sp. Se5.02b]|uniref:hypothetical protein n=1 Tax=Microbacterium sp. Se5.02b TaxID=2864103 RepID=UPI00215D6D38|nr:hypothetical protein [Microbacterium sp. Se5.02b]
MGAPQIDRHGNQNLSAIGPRDHPTHQLVGARGAATNTANHATSYFIPRHSTRVFVPEVDTVTGVGVDRAARLGMPFHDLRGVVTNLAVLDLAGADGAMRLVSVHPGCGSTRSSPRRVFPSTSRPMSRSPACPMSGNCI